MNMFLKSEKKQIIIKLEYFKYFSHEKLSSTWNISKVKSWKN